MDVGHDVLHADYGFRLRWCRQLRSCISGSSESNRTLAYSVLEVCCNFSWDPNRVLRHAPWRPRTTTDSRMLAAKHSAQWLSCSVSLTSNIARNLGAPAVYFNT